ncbi:MAG: hypothetical protein C0487_07510 [Leptothrix sp. (in: Bacteria)]|nr:hypothetical protein [Leptothrix sp. (in: b-proteobacteria)]
MKLKSIAAAGLMALAFGAQASTWDLSLGDFHTQYTTDKPVTFAGASAITYDFTFSGTPSILLSLSLNELKLGSIKDIDFTSIKVLDSASNVVSSWTPAALASFNLDSLPITSSFSLVLEGSVLKAGHYDLSVTAAAVPEPETYALVLAGVGVIGFTALRRRRVS